MQPPNRTGQTLLGKYRVVGFLGEGGMGHVYAAEDVRLGREVAIKILHHQAEVQARRMKREAQVIAQVNHNNLVVLLDYDELSDGSPCLVMERIKGESLRVLINAYRFSVGEVFDFLRQSLSALAACHEQGIVHRDLKPENVIMVAESQGFTAKIIDFGLTKLLAPDHSVLTMHGEVFGSPRFMAPEQWFRHPVDGRTDQYALALIGFCMLLGDHFIASGNPVSVCSAHVHAVRPTLATSTRGEPVPLRLAAALHRAASPGIEDRFPDARAMLAALESDAVLPTVRRDKAALADTADLPVTSLADDFNPQVLELDESLFDDDATALQKGFSVPVQGGDALRTQMDPNIAAAIKKALTPTAKPEPPTPEPSQPHVAAEGVQAINRSKVMAVRATMPETAEVAADESLTDTIDEPPTVEQAPIMWDEPEPSSGGKTAQTVAVLIGLGAMIGAAVWLFR